MAMVDVIFGTAKLASLLGTSATLTTDLLVKAVSFTASNIYYLTSSLASSPKIIGIKELEQLEKELDLLETIKIYESWIVELGQKKKELIETSNTIKISIESIHNSLEDLHQILKQIETRVERHQKKWFSGWRSQDFTKEINELKLKKKILDNRFKILQQIKIE
jgi:hypothetical protein